MAKRVDWIFVEQLYRAGGLKSRELVRQYAEAHKDQDEFKKTVTEGAIRKQAKAKAKGWKKDLAHMVKKEALEQLVRNDSRFGDCVRNEPINAEDGFYDQIGASDGTDITTRHADTQFANTPHARRKVTPIPWQWADLIDRADKVRLLGDPQNAYLLAAHAARNRRKDDHIINAFFSNAYTGKTGTTPVSFPAANQVVVDLGGSAEGLTVNKLIRARKLLIDNDIELDEEEIYIAVNGKALEDLLKTTQV